MSDEVIQMCGEHKDGRGYCQRALNHVGLHLFPPMPPHIYNQEEADALIAGAVRVAGEHVPVFAACVLGCRCGWRMSPRLDSGEFPVEWSSHIRAQVTPDAARLALEERIAEAVMAARERARAAFHKRGPNGECLCPVCTKDFEALVECAAEAEMEMAYEREHRAAREAKLIADTRLEEAEWWARCVIIPHPNCNCVMCTRLFTNRLAAHRAVVQPGGSL